jgi:uracil-DNA glycosylase
MVNLVFARSRRIQNLTGDLEQLVDACWPVHEFIIRTVKPKAIIALGQKTFEQIRRQTNLDSVEHISSGHADWQVSATKIDFYGRDISLVAPPHLSVYKIDAHQDVITWMKEKIELGAT